MRKLLSILAISFSMIGMIACDVIEEPYKKDNSGIGGGSDNENPDAVVKNVLLEDYTGVKCVNCPNAAVIANQLQEQYGHRLVVLAVHAAGDLSNPFGGFPNFITNEGNEWVSTFGISSFPKGTVNRKIYSGNKFVDSSSWADAVAETLQEEAVIDMKADVEYNDGTVDVEITSKFLTEMPDTYSLTVCVMEDSIVGKQKIEKVNPDDPEIIEDYVHRHVFRETINGTWGVDINTTALAPEDEIIESYSITLDDDYNHDQCYIVAYVSNSSTKEVLQVIEKKIK